MTTTDPVVRDLLVVDTFLQAMITLKATSESEKEIQHLRTQVQDRIHQHTLAAEEARRADQGAAQTKPTATYPNKTPTQVPQELIKKLDQLPWISSQYGGEWVPADKLPSWINDVRFPITTNNYEYNRSKKGHLQRNKPKPTTTQQHLRGS